MTYMRKLEIIDIARDFVDSRFMGLDNETYEQYVNEYAKGYEDALIDNEYGDRSNVDGHHEMYVEGYNKAIA